MVLNIINNTSNKGVESNIKENRDSNHIKIS